jgi:hypothetical protein
VTLSVTRDSHPKYPRFHKACCPLVFGLSSSEKFAPAIACHSGGGYHREVGRSSEAFQRSAINVQRRFVELISVHPVSFSFPKSNSNSPSYSAFFWFGGQSVDSHNPGVRRSLFAVSRMSPGSWQWGCPARRIVNFRMKLAKYVLVFRFDFTGLSGEIVEEKSLAWRGKTNIVHAPPRLAE